jgi:hypothetical protein
MKAVWTIAIEFARQQRVMLIIFAFWILGFDFLVAFFHRGNDSSDLAAIFTQQCIYGIAFTVFLSSSVLHTERNSRRVLAMLSKGITRAQYLGAHILGITLLAMLYFISAGVLFWLINRSFGVSVNVAETIAAGLTAALLATAVSFAFATWAHPLIAAVLTMFVLTAPMLFIGHSDALVVSPVAYFLRASIGFDHSQGWTGPWSYWLVAALETAAAWLAAALIFERQDVAVPTE